MVLKTRSRSIAFAVPVNSSAIHTIYTPGTVELDGTTYNYTGLIESLRLFAQITSLDSPTLPNFTGEETEAELGVLYRNFQFNSQRYEASVYRRQQGSAQWLKQAGVSIQRQNPFYTIELGALISNQVAARVAPGDEIGLSIDDVGYGLPDANDTLTLFADIEEELDLFVQSSDDIAVLTHAIDQQRADLNTYSQQLVTLASNQATILGSNGIGGITSKVDALTTNLALVKAETDKITALQTELALKADSSEISTLSTEVAVISTKLDTLIEAVNNLSVGSATPTDPFPNGNPEDGSAVTSNGSAVVSQGKAVIVPNN